MTIDTTATPNYGRITGTLHKRGYTHPAPLRDENSAKERAEEREIAGRHKNSEQRDHKDVR